MKKIVNVAAIQMYIEPDDIDANLKKATYWIDRLFQKQKVDLVVFPEDFITGPIPYRLDLNLHEKSPAINNFRKLASSYKTHIVCGSFIKKIKNQFFNTSILINPNGKILLEYHKNNLWHPERKYLTPGNQITVAKTSIGTIGIIICWDLAFPELCRELVKKGVDIICCPSYWTYDDGRFITEKYNISSEEKFVNTLCPARAIENEVCFIYANGAGIAKVNLKTKQWQSPQIGQSQIAIPVFGRVRKINDNSEGFIYYQYNRQLVNDAERVYKIKKDIISKNL